MGTTRSRYIGRETVPPPPIPRRAAGWPACPNIEAEIGSRPPTESRCGFQTPKAWLVLQRHLLPLRPETETFVGQSAGRDCRAPPVKARAHGQTARFPKTRRQRCAAAHETVHADGACRSLKLARARAVLDLPFASSRAEITARLRAAFSSSGEHTLKPGSRNHPRKIGPLAGG